MLHILLSVILVAVISRQNRHDANEQRFICDHIDTDIRIRDLKNVTVAMLTAAISYVVLSKMSLRENSTLKRRKII